MNQLEQKLEQDFGIVFSQKDLLETAFTHTSYANEHRLLNISHNERLEFLGDAALQLVISVYLYKRYPNKPEGEMSKMRSTIVREESLAGFQRLAVSSSISVLVKGKKNLVDVSVPLSLVTSGRPSWVPFIWIKGYLLLRNF